MQRRVVFVDCGLKVGGLLAVLRVCRMMIGGGGEGIDGIFTLSYIFGCYDLVKVLGVDSLLFFCLCLICVALVVLPRAEIFLMDICTLSAKACSLP